METLFAHLLMLAVMWACKNTRDTMEKQPSTSPPPLSTREEEGDICETSKMHRKNGTWW